jgi:signal transduction histidine kinase
MRILDRLSFQAKLLVAFIVVVVLATLIGYLFINHSVQRAFSAFTLGSYSPQEQGMYMLLRAFYERTGNINEVIDALNRSPGDTPFLLVNPDGVVVYAADEKLRGRRLDAAQLQQGQVLALDSGEEWTLVPSRFIVGQDILADAFLRTTRQSLWFAGLTAAVASIFLAFLLIRQMTGPLKRLDAAARNIAAGRLDERVDVTSKDEIGHLAASFNEMAGSLESAEWAKKQMIADVSHELRTPLTAVRGTLEGLRDGLIQPTTEALAGLHDKILLTTRLVQDLHQLALADAGRLSIQAGPTSLPRIVGSIVETIGVQLEDADVTLEQRLGEIPQVVVDAQRIEQVLLNLISNAIRHTPAEGTILIEAHRTGNDVQVSVCDSGPGISAEALPHIFDRFYRDDPARGGESGAGLGLSIAKALVEAHGGRIWAENAPAGGACFRFTLPAESAVC